jgi:hypothetical protein
MKAVLSGYAEARVRELFRTYFESVGKGLYRVRFNRRSENPTEWIPVDFFSKVRGGLWRGPLLAIGVKTYVPIGSCSDSTARARVLS